MSEKYLKRMEAVFLVNHPKGPKMSVRQAAKYIKRSVSFVNFWLKQYKQHGNIDDRVGRGLDRCTSKKQDKLICSLFLKNPTLSLKQAQQKLIAKGVKVSINTIRHRLGELDIKNRTTNAKPLLTEKHVQKRLSWANENLNRDWSNVIFTDESSFVVYNYWKKAWTEKGERLIQRTVKHPAKVHVYGCFSAKGFGSLFVFTENLNAERMVKLYQKCLLPSAKSLYGQRNQNWILQEDNDPEHRSRLCSQWKEENGIATMDWPSQSPDANPIENVWSLMKAKLRGKKITTTKSLTRALKRIWSGLNMEYAKNLSESCVRRCQAIIDNNGDWTPY